MIETEAGGPVFCILFLFHLLFHIANFSWMFVEGKRRAAVYSCEAVRGEIKYFTTHHTALLIIYAVYLSLPLIYLPICFLLFVMPIYHCFTSTYLLPIIHATSLSVPYVYIPIYYLLSMLPI